MKKLKRFTADYFLHFDPCYEEEHIRTLFDGRSTLSIKDILELAIPANDALWAVAATHLPAEIRKAAVKEFCNDSPARKLLKGMFVDFIKWFGKDYMKLWWHACQGDLCCDAGHTQAARDYIYAQLVAGGYE